MLAYRSYLMNMDKDELVNMVLTNKYTTKAVRNHLIIKEYLQLFGSMPQMDIYCHLSEVHKISEKRIQVILCGY